MRIYPNMSSIDRINIRMQNKKKSQNIKGKEDVIHHSDPVSVVELTFQHSSINSNIKKLWILLKTLSIGPKRL